MKNFLHNLLLQIKPKKNINSQKNLNCGSKKIYKTKVILFLLKKRQKVFQLFCLFLLQKIVFFSIAATAIFVAQNHNYCKVKPLKSVSQATNHLPNHRSFNFFCRQSKQYRVLLGFFEMLLQRLFSVQKSGRKQKWKI